MTLTAVNRYQSAPGLPGAMDTPAWFAALLRGIDGPLGTVLDVGCAEGVMATLAADHGASSVLGIGLHDDRMVAARMAASEYPNIEIREQDARTFEGSARTVVFSMMAHWLGREETARFARMATRNFAVIFRTANDHYERPANGTWFPTLEEMDATVGGVRTSETLLLTQDNEKEVWAATYRTDLWIVGQTVHKANGTTSRLRQGRDLHGDPPFRPTHGAPLTTLTDQEQANVRALARGVALDALKDRVYPSDFSPRNVIVNDRGAFLVDRDPDEEMPYAGRVDPEYLPIWQATLSTVGIAFSGDLRELL